VRKAATHIFISGTEANVTGLVLAGSADFKVLLSQSDILDHRLKTIIPGVLDICYGGEEGFNQAIHLAADIMKDVRLVRERELLARLFSMISTNGACSFGLRETMMAWDSGAVDTLLLWDELDVYRCTMRDAEGTESLHYFSQKQLDENSHPDGTADMMVEHVLLTEWMADHHETSGAKLEFVTNKSPEGAQFVKGLGGIGSFLRFQMSFDAPADTEDADAGFGSDSDEFETLV
jgi:peptide chain release factor subunit 1